MKCLLTILCSLMLLFHGNTAMAASHGQSGGGVDVKKIIFEHVKDSYEWHIATVGETHVSIPVPLIV